MTRTPKTPELIALDARLTANEAAWSEAIRRHDKAGMAKCMFLCERLKMERSELIRRRGGFVTAPPDEAHK